MGWKIAISLAFIFVTLSLLILYWFVPLSTTEFTFSNYNTEIDTGNLSPQALQFYPNMRFDSTSITYKIHNCVLQKRDEMIRAFKVIEDKTVLNFKPVLDNEEISIHCDSTQEIEGGLFIAGEGGPTNITKSGDFNVISNGKILLYRESKCSDPNVATHELLHVLGFDHVSNKEDIMYPVSNCGQQISQSTIDLIDELYIVPSYPDLSFENASAIMHGKYLNLNISIRNAGLSRSPKTTVDIYAGTSKIKEIDLESLEIGHGRIISLTNIWVSKLSVENIGISIVSNFDELDKGNNHITLSVK